MRVWRETDDMRGEYVYVRGGEEVRVVCLELSVWYIGWGYVVGRIRCLLTCEVL